MTIKKRRGLMSIAIALMLLIFSIVAYTVISSISTTLFKNIAEMGEGKEDQYKRIVIRSLKNALESDSFDFSGFELGTSTTYEFTYSVKSKRLVNASEEIVISYPATVEYIADDPTDFFEVYTTPSTNTTGGSVDTYGIIMQF